MSKGAVKLVIQLTAYPAAGTSYPDVMHWYEGDKEVEYYSYGMGDSESWNHLEKDILDIVDVYGKGTAGSSIGGN